MNAAFRIAEPYEIERFSVFRIDFQNLAHHGNAFLKTIGFVVKYAQSIMQIRAAGNDFQSIV